MRTFVHNHVGILQETESDADEPPVLELSVPTPAIDEQEPESDSDDSEPPVLELSVPTPAYVDQESETFTSEASFVSIKFKTEFYRTFASIKHTRKHICHYFRHH